MGPEPHESLVLRALDLLDAGSRPPLVVGVDGRSGSGKTDLAGRLEDGLAEAGTAVTTVHLDDLYPGWSGLSAGLETLCQDVLLPLRTGRPAAYRSWDWVAGVPGPLRPVRPAAVLLVEGVGVLSSGCSDLVDLRVWLEAPADVRRVRALARDGETFAPWWTTWAEQEERLLRHGRPEADVVLDTVSGRLTWSRLAP
ncbi:hypothetical protein [Ornithinimicrobium tianjinense]|uniref:Adenylate kinase n=1 Tax=Ornithinimicrobium tianjinense TaxID=1195761 RepID=A0A917BJP8_9MICO|nr:hypothetical protein [Ornithinimicrobium tianjinense]GGF48319.1 adenylate kinase [Ornithinimicrobium tianjinense]